MKRLIPVFLLAILIPQVTLAAWWNPFSWTKGVSEKPQTQLIERGVIEEKVAEDSEEKVSDESIQVKPKVEERVIKVTDPTLQIQINALITENTNLRARIMELESKLSSYIGIEKQNEILRINQQKEKEIEEKSRLGAQQQAQLKVDERRKALNIEIAQLNADRTKLSADESRCPAGPSLNQCSKWAFGHVLFPELVKNQGLAYREAYKRIEVRIAELKVELAGL